MTGANHERPSTSIIRATQLIESPQNLRPHVVLLGAGASLAACPNGDAAGRILPVMDNVVEVVGLQSIIPDNTLESVPSRNFEAVYSRLRAQSDCGHIVKEVEHRIERYFSELVLPSQATIYDQLLVSLRPTDAVFTFNWDPFLFDAYKRNHLAVELPEIFFLHGNVRIATCLRHDRWGQKEGQCPDCGKDFSAVPLLYPIEEKDYSKDPYIRRNWDAAEKLFRDAFTLTIFGYGAPDSDTDAVNLLRSAWMGRSDRKMEHIEIIDTACKQALGDRWAKFAPTNHDRIMKKFEDSRLANWPRRSCEAIFYPMTEGKPCEKFPFPRSKDLEALQTAAARIEEFEVEAR